MTYATKSPWVIHYDGSSCNGCDIEVLAALCPGFDVERFGIINTGNPKHADIFLVTGSVNEQNIGVVQEIYNQMVEPKVVIACGICACSAGIFHDCYNVIGGVDQAIPVDVYAPGCAVRPEAIIDAVVQGLGILEEKIESPAGAKERGVRNVTLQSEFIPLTIEGLPALAAEKKAEGARFVQMLCVNTEEGIDLVYSFMKDGVLTNHEIKGVKKGTTVPSVTDQFLAAFVFENEAHDLFGVDIEGIAIDFGGNFYALAQKEPMTIISPEQKAAREKARKVAEAKAAKERAAKAAEASYVASHPEAKSKPTGDVIKPSGSDDLDARLAGVDPEKVARVKAAIAAKAKKEAAAKQAAADEKIANLDPEKAAKVKAALEAKAAREAAKTETEKEGE